MGREPVDDGPWASGPAKAERMDENRWMRIDRRDESGDACIIPIFVQAHPWRALLLGD